jgi:hypothetical protein
MLERNMVSVFLFLFFIYISLRCHGISMVIVWVLYEIYNLHNFCKPRVVQRVWWQWHTFLCRNTSSVSSRDDLLSSRGSHQQEEWHADLLGCCSEPYLCKSY